MKPSAWWQSRTQLLLRVLAVLGLMHGAGRVRAVPTTQAQLLAEMVDANEG